MRRFAVVVWRGREAGAFHVRHWTGRWHRACGTNAQRPLLLACVSSEEKGRCALSQERVVIPPQPKRLSDQIIAAMPWLDEFAEKLRVVWEPLVGQSAPRPLRDALYGTWLGHPLHPAVVLLPVGFWTSSAVFDLLGEEEPADLMLKLGLGGAIVATVTGAAQWQDSGEERKPRRLGALHAGLNTLATVLYASSWVLRARGSRGAGVALSTAGYGLVSVSSWLGGELAYDLGLGVNRTAFETPAAKWTKVAAAADLLDGKPLRVEVEGTPVMLLRQGESIFAIGATCTHLGGPLDEGEIDGDTVICPWHGSVFRLNNGGLVHGPATFPQPGYDVRVESGQVAIRLAS